MSESDEEKAGSAGGVGEGMKDGFVMYDLLLEVLLRLEDWKIAVADIGEVVQFLGDFVGRKERWEGQ